MLQTLLCELGERMAGQWQAFNDALSQCDWYLFPMEMQRMFVILTVNAQQFKLIQGFGNLPCIRETVKRVI